MSPKIATVWIESKTLNTHGETTSLDINDHVALWSADAENESSAKVVTWLRFGDRGPAFSRDSVDSIARKNSPVEFDFRFCSVYMDGTLPITTAFLGGDERLSIVINPGKLTFEDVTELLGIPPTGGGNIGDSYEGFRGRVRTRKKTAWFHDVEPGSQRSWSDDLNALIKPQEIVDDLNHAGAKLELRYYHDSHGGAGGPLVPPPFWQFSKRLNCEVSFDAKFYGGASKTRASMREMPRR